MKKFTLLLSALLMFSLSALAQIKMYLHFNDGTRVEYIASRVDSITFDSQIQEPEDSETPDGPVLPDDEDTTDKEDNPVKPDDKEENDDPVKPDDSTDSSVDANGYEYVDLGLPSGLLWATMNVGADSPEDYGDYFAWGETEPKDYYYWDTYKWCEGSFNTPTLNFLIKYCVDNKTILELSDDAANANWGGDWRMPTKEDQDELLTQCTWTWRQKNGVRGYTVTGPNGNSIFLPYAGYRFDYGLYIGGSYWSSSLDTSYLLDAYYLSFGAPLIDVGRDGSYRYYGRSVRPVLRVGFTYDAIFDSNGGEGTMPSIAIEYAKQLSIPANKFTRPGYEFICWNTKADGTGVNYEEGDVFCVASDITLYAQWEESKGTGTANGHEWVDLGLSSGTLWATMNVGADSPEDYGDYFAWGETTTKSEYNWSTYKWMTDGMSSWQGVNKYTYPDGQTDAVWYDEYGNFIGDNKTVLELADDAANVNWGGDWRMPTKEDQDELRTQCTWTWEQKNGVNGYTVIGPNGNSIFLPAAGCRDDSDLDYASSYGGYWSSSLRADYSYLACSLRFFSSYVDWYYDVGRSYGRSVRPVLRVGFTYDATFDSNGGDGTMPSITIAHAKQLSVPENKFSRPGYEFICWNTKADGKGVNYEEGDVFCVASDITLYAQWYKNETNITHEYVDLGLSVKWATCNVGATKPEETGYFFAWGETRPKAKYDWSTYKWCEGSDDTQTKYCTDSYYGTVDNKTILELSDDAANVNWGGSWRIPTKAEQDELRTECTWTWTTQNGVDGYKVTSKTNGNSIFLPAAGYRSNSDLYYAGLYGLYWSRSLSTSYSYYAYYLFFDSSDVDLYSVDRNDGLSVRPVLP